MEKHPQVWYFANTNHLLRALRFEWKTNDGARRIHWLLNDSRAPAELRLLCGFEDGKQTEQEMIEQVRRDLRNTYERTAPRT